MQHRARFSLRHIGFLALAVGALAPACQDGPLSDEEMDLLRGSMLPAGPPADPSNASGDLLAAAKLGKLLFFDPAYSGPLGSYNVAGVNGAVGAAMQEKMIACRDCHDPATGGVDRRSRPNATSLGADYTDRNAPSVINAAYSPLWQFWDGRADSLWSQALAPPEGATECNSSRLAVAHFLFDYYRAQYNDVFSEPLPDALATETVFPAKGKPGDSAFDAMAAGDKATINRIYANFGKAVAAYERRLVSNAFEPSDFDRFMAGDAQAMSPAAIRGARLFVGRAGCAECHRGPMFTDYTFHNIGVPQTGVHVPATDLGRSAGIDAIAGAIKKDMAGDPNPYDFTKQSAFSDAQDDTHLASLTAAAPGDAPPRRPTDGQFKTPTLRNVAKTAPYMHDGAYATLWDVVNHYNFGGATGPYVGDKDPALGPLLLTDAELGDLVEFLRALDDGPVRDTRDFDQPDLRPGDRQGLLGEPVLPGRTPLP
jgi:cytochrome c peroxidase